MIKAEEGCSNDNSCKEFYSCEDQICVYKGLFPLSAKETIGAVVTLMASCIINAGGIELNSIIISILLMIFNFEVTSSVAMAQAFIFSGTALFISLRLNERHPCTEKSLICYDLLFQIMGPVMLGASIAMLINFCIPQSAILVPLTAATGFLLWKTLLKARDMVRPYGESSETKKKSYLEEGLRCLLSRSDSCNLSIFENFDKSETQSRYTSDRRIHKITSYQKSLGNNSFVSYSNTDELAERLMPDNYTEKTLATQVNCRYSDELAIKPFAYLAYFTIISIISLVFALLYSNPFILNIAKDSREQLILVIAYVLIMSLLMIISSYIVSRKTEICLRDNYEIDEDEIEWDYRKCLITASYGIFAGFCMGTFGASGTWLIMPLMAALGVKPEIATISTSFLVLLISGTIAGQNYFTGDLQLDYAIFFSAIAVTGAIIGLYVIRKLAFQYNKISVLMIISTLVVFITTIAIVYATIRNAI